DAEAVRVGDLDNAIDALEELGPGAVRKLGSTGVAALRERRSEDDELRAARGQPFRLAFDGGELVSAARALVEHRRDEAADKPKLTRVEQRMRGSGVGRKESVGSGLGRAQAEGTHVLEDTVRSELQAPVRRLRSEERRVGKEWRSRGSVEDGSRKGVRD